MYITSVIKKLMLSLFLKQSLTHLCVALFFYKILSPKGSQAPLPMSPLSLPTTFFISHVSTAPLSSPMGNCCKSPAIVARKDVKSSFSNADHVVMQLTTSILIKTNVVRCNTTSVSPNTDVGFEVFAFLVCFLLYDIGFRKN